MAVKNWYLTNTTANSWRTVDEATQTAATLTDGCVIGTTGDGATAGYRPNSEGPTFSGTTQPDGSLDTTNFDALRTTSAYSGAFASANWTFNLVGRPVSSATSQAAACVIRLFRSANADGTGATEITSAQQTGTTTAAMTSTTTDYTSTVTFNPGAFTLTNEYLFFQLAYKRVTAASMSTADWDLRTGSSSSVGSRIASADFTPAVVATASITEAADTLTSNASAIPALRGATFTDPNDYESEEIDWVEMAVPTGQFPGLVSTAGGVAATASITEAADTSSATATAIAAPASRTLQFDPEDYEGIDGVENYEWIPQWTPPVSTGVTASASITEAADTTSATAATVAVVATASVTEVADTTSATAGTVAVVATSSVTEVADTTTSAVAVGVVATAAVTEAADTTSATAAVAVVATASITEAANTTTSAATAAVVATASITEVADTTTAAVTAAVVASATVTEAADTTTAAAVVPVVASATVTEAADTVTGAAVVLNGPSANANITEVADTVSSAATAAVVGAAGITEAADTVSATATAPLVAAASITEAANTTTAAAVVPVVATATITEVADTASATASVLSGVVATASITEAADTATAAATTAVVAAAAMTEAADTLTSTTASGSAVTRNALYFESDDSDSDWLDVQVWRPDVTTATGPIANANITEGADTVSAAGTVTGGSVTVTANITEVADTLTAVVTGGTALLALRAPLFYDAADYEDDIDWQVWRPDDTSVTSTPRTADANITEAADTTLGFIACDNSFLLDFDPDDYETLNWVPDVVVWRPTPTIATGVVLINANITEAADTSASGWISIVNSFLMEFDPDDYETLNWVPDVTVWRSATAPSGGVEARDTASSTASVLVLAAGAATEARDTLAATGAVGNAPAITANASILEARDTGSAVAVVLVRIVADIKEEPDTGYLYDLGPPAKLVSYHSAGLWADGADVSDNAVGTFADSLQNVSIGLPRPDDSSFTTEFVDFGIALTGKWSVSGTYQKEAGSIAGEPVVYIDLSDNGSTVRETIAPNENRTARYARMRLVCPPGLGVVTYETWTVTCGVVPRTEQGTVTITGSGTAQVVLAGRYQGVLSIQLTPKSASSRTVSWENLVLSAVAANHFDVYLFNGTTPVAGDVMWNFTGIGA